MSNTNLLFNRYYYQIKYLKVEWIYIRRFFIKIHKIALWTVLIYLFYDHSRARSHRSSIVHWRQLTTIGHKHLHYESHNAWMRWSSKKTRDKIFVPGVTPITRAKQQMNCLKYTSVDETPMYSPTLKSLEVQSFGIMKIYERTYRAIRCEYYIYSMEFWSWFWFSWLPVTTRFVSQKRLREAIVLLFLAMALRRGLETKQYINNSS